MTDPGTTTFTKEQTEQKPDADLEASIAKLRMEKQKDDSLSTNRLAEKLEMSKTEISAFVTSDEQTFKQMGNSNYCVSLFWQNHMTNF